MMDAAITYRFPKFKNIFDRGLAKRNCRPIKYFMCVDPSSSNYGIVMRMLTDEESKVYNCGEIICGVLKVVAWQEAVKQIFH